MDNHSLWQRLNSFEMFITFTGAERERFKCQLYYSRIIMSNFDPKKSTDWFIFTRFFSTHLGTHFWKSLKVDSGDPPCKDVITRWTMVPLNTLSDQVCIRYPFGFVYLNCLFSFAVSLRNWVAHSLLIGSNGETIAWQCFFPNVKNEN